MGWHQVYIYLLTWAVIQCFFVNIASCWYPILSEGTISSNLRRVTYNIQSLKGSDGFTVQYSRCTREFGCYYIAGFTRLEDGVIHHACWWIQEAMASEAIQTLTHCSITMIIYVILAICSEKIRYLHCQRRVVSFTSKASSRRPKREQKAKPDVVKQKCNHIARK